jgi:pyruvate kinase
MSRRIKANPPLECDVAQKIFDNTTHAMQAAEEISGPDYVDYIDLMHAIANEALKRAQNCHSTHMRQACIDLIRETS